MPPDLEASPYRDVTNIVLCKRINILQVTGDVWVDSSGPLSSLINALAQLCLVQPCGVNPQP